MGGEDDDPGLGTSLEDVLGGVDAVLAGQLDVDDADVGLELLDDVDDLLAGLGLADDLDALNRAILALIASRTISWSSQSTTRLESGFIEWESFVECRSPANSRKIHDSVASGRSPAARSAFADGDCGSVQRVHGYRDRLARHGTGSEASGLVVGGVGAAVSSR